MPYQFTSSGYATGMVASKDTETSERTKRLATLRKRKQRASDNEHAKSRESLTAYSASSRGRLAFPGVFVSSIVFPRITTTERMFDLHAIVNEYTQQYNLGVATCIVSIIGIGGF